MAKLHLLAFAAVLLAQSFILAEEEPQVMDERCRAALFGFACADQNSSRPQSQAALALANETKTPNTPSALMCKLLALSETLTTEGGLDVAKARNVVFGQAGQGSQSALALASARTEWESARQGIDSRLEKLTRVVPVAIAYSRAPAELLNAAAAAVSLDGKDSPELRGAARVYAVVLAENLRAEPADRKEILAWAKDAAGNEKAEQMVERVCSDSLFDIASGDPVEAMGGVLHAWYHSKNYDDAIARLGQNAGAARRGLCGALAGATYGLAHVQPGKRLSVTVASCIDATAAKLYDLARDSVLISVGEELPSTENQPEQNPQTAKAAAEKTQQEIDAEKLQAEAEDLKAEADTASNEIQSELKADAAEDGKFSAKAQAASPVSDDSLPPSSIKPIARLKTKLVASTPDATTTESSSSKFSQIPLVPRSSIAKSSLASTGE